MASDSKDFRERRHVQLLSRSRRAADDGDHYTRMADAVTAEFTKPADAMIDAAYEVVRFDEAWAINSRRGFIIAVKALGLKRAGL
jgi:hypothetical protein